MAQENIRFPRSHMSIKDGYFYYFDERNGTLVRKTCDGTLAFIWPIEGSLGTNQVKSVEYDGNFFWTLQQGTEETDSVIKKWVVDNYVCKLSDTITLSHTVDDNFSCDSFSLEYYTTTLAAEVPIKSSQLTIKNYYDKITSGTVLTLGPNNYGVYEDVTVTGTLGSSDTFGLDFYTFNEFPADAPINFAKSIWLINDYYHTQETGALYEFSLVSNRVINVIQDDDFDYVTASCFYNNGENQYILYVFGNSIRFYNILNKSNEKSMFIDNLKSDQATTVTIYEIKVADDTIYRLQGEASYYGTDYDWDSYNYQVSTFRPFVDSMSMDVSPKILPSNGLSLAEITISVRDQYNDPLQFKPVLVEDDDPNGYITTTEVYTNLYGVATTYYRAGLVPAVVTIGSLATQYD